MISFFYVVALAAAILTMAVSMSTAMDQHPRPDVELHTYFPVWEKHDFLRRPTHQKLGDQHDDLSEVSSAVRAGTSDGIAQPLIPRFRDANGKEWGPYVSHPDRFQAVEYPLDLSSLSHLYAKPPVFGTEQRGRKSNHWVKVNRLIYRPEPDLLRHISDFVKNGLERKGIGLTQVSQRVPDLREGMYLLPPLQPSDQGLEMPWNLLQDRFANVVSIRLQNRNNNVGWFILHLPTQEGEKRILVATAHPEAFTNLSTELTNSKVWLLYNTHPQSGGEHYLSLLGAMFMPKNAVDVLKASGLMRNFHAS